MAESPPCIPSSKPPSIEPSTQRAAELSALEARIAVVKARLQVPKARGDANPSEESEVCNVVRANEDEQGHSRVSPASPMLYREPVN